MKRTKTCGVLNVNFDAYSATGGIQRYCRMMDDILEDLKVPSLSISLWDRQRDKPAGSPLRDHVGCEHGKLYFLVVFIRALLQQRPRIVWFRHVMLLPLLPLVRLLSHAEVWVSIYGIEVWEGASSLGLRFLKRADRVIAISRHTAGIAERLHGVNPARQAICPLGVDRGFSENASDDSDPVAVPDPETPYVLVVSRLDLPDAERKGVTRVCEAMEHVVAALPRARCLIVGEGRHRPTLEAKVRAMPWGGSVTWMGRVTDSELDRLYAGASVFALPSTVEGFGLVYVEAMVNGCAVVAGDEDAASDVVIDGVTGCLVNAGNVGEIGRVLVELLGDPERRRAMGEAGRRRVLQEFTYEAMRERVGNLLEGVLVASITGLVSSDRSVRDVR